MCIPCAAGGIELLPLIGWILLGLLVVAGSLVVGLWRSLPLLAAVGTWVAMVLYRWFSGATLAKPLHTPEKDLPARKLARHVHATGRTVIPALAAVGYAYTWIGIGLLSLTAGGALGIGLHRMRLWRDRKLSDRELSPRRVHVQIGAGR